MSIASHGIAGESAGCGLGSTLFKGKSGLIPNILAVTTNGTSGNQTFGMTSGTLGCDPDSTVMNETEQMMFLADNAEFLFDDMSKGNGAYLLAYGQLMGCEKSMTAFAIKMQSHHEHVFSLGLGAESILENTNSVIGSDKILSTSCTAIN